MRCCLLILSAIRSRAVRSKLPAALLAAFAALPLAAFAQAWPGGGPISLVLGFPPGSGVDVVARLLQEPMEKTIGQRLIFEYKAGAGGNVASEVVAHSKPDGYTVLFGTAATHGINAALYRKLPFDVEADFVPIVSLVDVSNVLTINPKVIDVHTVREFIDLVRANPGKYNYASTGNGTGTHLAFAEFNAKAGLDMVHIPYKGGPEALQAVVKGEVCCIFNQVQSVLAQSRAGTVRLLGVTTLHRVAAVESVPTISEAGLPGFESYTWFALFGPRGMDQHIVDRLNAAAREAMAQPAVRQRLIDTGNAPRDESPEQFKATVKANRAKWAEVVKASGATVD